MSDPAGDRIAVHALTELRAALLAHGIILPSLDLHLPSYAAAHPAPPLITLGNCNPTTAQRLTAVLNRAVGR